jgi:hypothetical protein
MGQKCISSPFRRTRKADIPFGISAFLFAEGLERAAPVGTLVQKLRAGEQFLARGRVHGSETTRLLPAIYKKCPRIPMGILSFVSPFSGKGCVGLSAAICVDILILAAAQDLRPMGWKLIANSGIL